VRPPGHHSTPNRAMGFCILSNVAIAVRQAQVVYGIKRVMVVDYDVHHGNGTQDVFMKMAMFSLSPHTNTPSIRERVRLKIRVLGLGKVQRSMFLCVRGMGIAAIKPFLKKCFGLRRGVLSPN
jgi:hypothetical protein